MIRADGTHAANQTSLIDALGTFKFTANFHVSKLQSLSYLGTPRYLTKHLWRSDNGGSFQDPVFTAGFQGDTVELTSWLVAIAIAIQFNLLS